MTDPTVIADRIEITRHGAVADVKLARAAKLNALDMAMFDALIEAGDLLAADKSVRAVVLSGEGRGFSAGLDVASFGASMASPDALEKFLAPYAGGPANRAQQVGYTWTSLPVPVIAAIHGVCFGGGLQIALGADIRLVHPEARMSVMEIKWGLIPDMSGTQTLRHLVGLDVAKELTFTGREVSGEEAVRLGLATRIEAEPHAAAMAMAEAIAGRSPHTIRAGKKLLNASVALPLAEGLALEAELQRGLIGTPNQMEAVMANMAKRPPKFQDPE